MSMSAIEFMNEFMCEGNKNNADEADSHSQTFITVNAGQTEKELQESFVGVCPFPK